MADEIEIQPDAELPAAPPETPPPPAQPPSDGKKFHCPECGRGFTQRHSLKSHMMKFHPKAQASTTSLPEVEGAEKQVPAKKKTETEKSSILPKRKTFLETAFFRR